MFVSGKDEAYAWEQPKISTALSETQKTILKERGVLTPAQLHELASKTRHTMAAEAADADKAACHSDRADEEVARTLQEKQIGPVDVEAAAEADALLPTP